MAGKEIKSSDVVGCSIGILTLLITMPCWYALTIGVLVKIDAPAWMWIVFWIYMPVGIICGLVREFASSLKRSGE